MEHIHLGEFCALPFKPCPSIKKREKVKGQFLPLEASGSADLYIRLWDGYPPRRQFPNHQAAALYRAMAR